MEKFTDEQIKDVKDFAEFYIDLIENHRETFVYYLSESAVLDWFGKTVKGVKNIGIFLKNSMANITHNFPKVEPCTSIGFRDAHIVKYTIKEIKSCTPIVVNTNADKTPPNILSPGSSRKREKGQGDGVHNLTSESPMKKARTGGDTPESPVPVDTSIEISNLTSDGHIEFHRKSSKKYQRETKWARPCKFQVSYTKTQSDYVIHLIIYEGNMKCRRNLLKDFEATHGE